MPVTEYICPMHPEILQDHPGQCPLCGMDLEPRNAGAITELSEYKDMLFRFIVGLLFSIPVWFLAMGNPALFPAKLSGWLQLIFSTPTVLWAGWPFFERGWKSIIQRHLNMFSLISLGLGAAFLYSLIALIFPHWLPTPVLHQGETPLYFESAATITVLVLLGQVLELKARSQTGQAIKALLERSAKTARILVDDRETDLPIDLVKIGDILRVRPGDKIPVDGQIVEGGGLVDESMITGEPIPVNKEPGSFIIGGTINRNGSFLMEAKKVGNQTILSRIIKMVSEAQRSRAPIQSLVDKVAGFFVPLVIFISILTFIIWFWIGPEPSYIYAFVNAVAVLIIACPCALGLATPMSILVGMGRGAEAGVLIKNAAALEKLEKANTLVIDKTGTLTEGKPKLAEVISRKHGQENEVLRLTASIEQYSEHPIAAAIVQEAKERFLTIPKAQNFQSFTGEGIFGIVENHRVLAGKLKFLEERKMKDTGLLSKRALELQSQALSIIYVAVDGEAVGLISVSDPIKASTQEAINELHRMKKKIVILSGDNSHTTESVAKKLHIHEIHSGINPEMKQQFIKQIISRNEIVAMAGDGINDAPALAAADVGIAMGTGTDVAMESADVTLVKGNLMGIVRAFRLSKAMMRNIRQNLFFAFVYNVIGIPIAAGIFYPLTGLLLSPMIAALAMSLSSVSVIVNALRLRYLKL